VTTVAEHGHQGPLSLLEPISAFTGKFARSLPLSSQSWRRFSYCCFIPASFDSGMIDRIKLRAVVERAPNGLSGMSRPERLAANPTAMAPTLFTCYTPMPCR
jgi:hypothetical protein